MAVHAIRTHSPELAHRRAGVTRGAFDRRVRAEKRETVRMLFASADRHHPAVDRVALFTLGPELVSVQVRMAISTLRTHVGEDQLHVAGTAVHLGVHAPQWIARLVVAKLGMAPERLPTGQGVTAITLFLERSVGVAGLAALETLVRAGPHPRRRTE